MLLVDLDDVEVCVIWNLFLCLCMCLLLDGLLLLDVLFKMVGFVVGFVLLMLKLVCVVLFE